MNLLIWDFCPRRNLNSVEDYSSSSVGVVCRVSCVCRLSCVVSNFKHGIISKRFELEGWNFVWFKTPKPQNPKTPTVWKYTDWNMDCLWLNSRKMNGYTMQSQNEIDS